LGDAAVLVPPGDADALAGALRKLADDRTEVARLRAAALQLARARFAPREVVTPLVHAIRHPERRSMPSRPNTTPVLTSSIGMDSVAPLTPNAWLRFDVLSRVVPACVVDVLEVGCGQGALGVRLAQRFSYLGVEPDAASFAVAQRRIAEIGRGEVRNIAVADLGAETFDMVCAFEVLEHIEDDVAAVREWSKRLRHNGWLVLSVPAYQHRFGPADELVGHFRRYDPDALTELLRANGFSEIEVYHYGAPLGYLLEAGRNAVGRRRLAKTTASVEERTAGSGRLLQPSNGLRGVGTRWATAPFRLAQRAFPNTGPGLVVRARFADQS
jgi:SAM-dependent methyltransferase